MKHNSPYQVPTILRKARLSLGCTQKELAARTHMRQSQLCALEVGRRVLQDEMHLLGLQAALAEVHGAGMELGRAARHDRLLALAHKLELTVAQQRALSKAILVIQLMNDAEASALGERLIAVVESMTWLSMGGAKTFGGVL